MYDLLIRNATLLDGNTAERTRDIMEALRIAPKRVMVVRSGTVRIDARSKQDTGLLDIDPHQDSF